MDAKKPLTKIEFFKRELATDDYYPTELCINKILEGNPSDFIEDALVDYVQELEREWLENPIRL